MNLQKEMKGSGSLLVVLDEKEYEQKLVKLLQSLGTLGKKICYVCLSRPYKYVIQDLRNDNIDTRNFFFIDVLSSHYGDTYDDKNCFFVSSPTNLVAISDAIVRAIQEKKCEVIFFDTLSTLLIYKPNHTILAFTQEIIHKPSHSRPKKIFVSLKGGNLLHEERDSLIHDIMMFVDKSMQAKIPKKTTKEK